MFLNHQFELYSQNGQLNHEIFVSLMKSTTGQVSKKHLKNYTNNKQNMSFDEFSSIYRAILNLQKHQSEALTILFNQSISGGR